MGQRYAFDRRGVRRLIESARAHEQGPYELRPEEIYDRPVFESDTEPTINFRNDSSETMPAYGVGEVTGSVAFTSLDAPLLTVGKPGDNWGMRYLINSGESVAAGYTGTGYIDGRAFALLDNSYSHLAGRSLGPQSGSWKLHINRPGFKSLQEATIVSTKYADVLFDELNFYSQLANGSIDGGKLQSSDGEQWFNWFPVTGNAYGWEGIDISASARKHGVTCQAPGIYNVVVTGSARFDDNTGTGDSVKPLSVFLRHGNGTTPGTYGSFGGTAYVDIVRLNDLEIWARWSVNGTVGFSAGEEFRVSASTSAGEDIEFFEVFATVTQVHDTV